MQENLSSRFSDNNGTDQPALPRRLLSAFVIRFVEIIISKLTTGEISMPKLVSVDEKTGFKTSLTFMKVDKSKLWLTLMSLCVYSEWTVHSPQI